MREPVIHDPLTKRELVRELQTLAREVERKIGVCKGRSGRHHLRSTKFHLDVLISAAIPKRK